MNQRGECASATLGLWWGRNETVLTLRTHSLENNDFIKSHVQTDRLLMTNYSLLASFDAMTNTVKFLKVVGKHPLK